MENDFNTQTAELFRALGKVENDGNLAEYAPFASEIRPEVFAQLLMQMLPLFEGRVPPEMVYFWHSVAEYMGPDYLKGFRGVGHLMNVLDTFQVK